jgi:hypothetical protein
VVIWDHLQPSGHVGSPSYLPIIGNNGPHLTARWTRFYYGEGLETAGITMSGAGLGRETGVISTFTLTS